MFTDYNTEYDIPCYYCSLYNEITKDYPINSATIKSIKLTQEIPRCLFHFQYVCNICNQSKHFNGIAWCSDCKQFTCTSCSSVKIIEFDFFYYDYYYEINCTLCNKKNPALDAAEYLLQHPYQNGDLRPDFPINLWIPTIEQYETSDLKGQNPLERYESWKSRKSENPIKIQQIINHYDDLAEKVSKAYLKDQVALEMVYPQIMSELGDLTGKTILDFGCGPGGLTRQLVNAKTTVGLDPSNMIDLAVKMEGENPLGIIYHKSDITRVKNQYLNKFDLIVSNAVLTEMPDLNKILQELSETMVQNGKLIFTIRHPCFGRLGGMAAMTIPIDSERNEDLVMTRKNYFAEGPYVLLAEGHYMDGAITHHYTLSTYINTLTQIGFTIEKLFEPRPSSELIKSNPVRFKNASEYHPIFLGVVARKL